MNELRKLRDAVWGLMNDGYGRGLSDEEWYDRLWKLLDPVIDARAGQALADVPTHDAGEYRDPSTGEMTYAEANELVLKHQREKAERQRNAAVNTVLNKQRDAERCPATWNPGAHK